MMLEICVSQVSGNPNPLVSRHICLIHVMYETEYGKSNLLPRIAFSNFIWARFVCIALYISSIIGNNLTGLLQYVLLIVKSG